MFNNREEFINTNISEKITLAHINCAFRLYGFDNPSLNIYTKKTQYFVTDVSNYTESVDENVSIGEFYFDKTNRILYIGTDQDIDNEKIIVNFRLFFANAPVITSWNLEDAGVAVEYEARLESSPNFKSNIGVDQRGVSFTNSGKISLENQDGYFDDLYDYLIFENKPVEIYSWNPSLPPSEAKILFRGNLYDKTYSSSQISFQAKDSYTRLEESLILPPYSSSDGVRSEDIGKYKRRIYGRNDGVLVRSIDQIASGFQLVGTVSSDIERLYNIQGINTLFTTELSVGNIIEVNSVELTVENIISDTELEASQVRDISVNAEEDSISIVTLTVLAGSISSDNLIAKQINGLSTNFTVDLESGDQILVRGEYLEVDQIIDNNTLTVTSNISSSFTGQTYSKRDTTSITGDVTFYAPNRELLGTGTEFLKEVSGEDILTIDGNTYGVEKVIDDTTILLEEDSPITFDITNLIATNVPEKGYPYKNRTFQVSSHALKEYNFTIDQQTQANRVTLVDATGLFSGDVITFSKLSGFTQTVQVSRVSFNRITLAENLNESVDASTTVYKSPIFNTYINNNEVRDTDIISLSNTSDAFTFTLSDRAEFNIARNLSKTNSSLRFISGSRNVDILIDNGLTDLIGSRDYIKGYGDSNSLFTEILEVTEDRIILRTPYEGLTGVKNVVYKSLDLLQDDSKVSVDCLGKTKDNTPSGELIETGPAIARDLIEETDLLNLIDTNSFDESEISSPYLLGKVIPSEFDSTSLPTIKDIIDEINETINGSMVISSDLTIRYNTLDIQKPESYDLTTIRFDDILRWSVKSKANSIYINTIANYRFNESTELNKTYSYSNIDAVDFNTSNKTNELTLLSYDDNESNEITESSALFNSFSKNEITIISDLRLSKLGMGDKVLLDIPRLYKRLGDPNTRLKIGTIVGITISGEQVTLKISDLGNMYNKGSVISDNNALDYDLAESTEKTYVSYITDENGVINNEQDLQGTNLIF